MSVMQKIVLAVLPRKWAHNIEVASRDWIARCPCGFERSYWDGGGIRWTGGGKENVYLYCWHCGQSRWHTIYRKPSADGPEVARGHGA